MLQIRNHIHHTYYKEPSTNYDMTSQNLELNKGDLMRHMDMALARYIAYIREDVIYVS